MSQTLRRRAEITEVIRCCVFVFNKDKNDDRRNKNKELKKRS